MLNISKLIVIFSTIFSILISQEHFIPIYSGNPYLAMNLYASSATIETVNMTVNDEIGIFDGENCVGAGVLLDQIYESFSLKAATDDPGTPDIDGFTPGNQITYRLWDASSETEITDVTATYSYGEGIFASQGTVAFDLAGIDNCVNQNCSENGTCVDTGSNYICTCNGYYSGTDCETDIDECATDNGGCDANATCTNNEGAVATCTCNDGYSGDGTTCADIDECLTANGGCVETYETCTNNAGAAPTCSDIDECLTENGSCDDNAACANNVGAVATCTCNDGYSGDGTIGNCEILSLFNGLIPEDFSIHSIYPNPFNPVTNIIYGLSEYVNVQIIIYDLSGKQIETLINEFTTQGYHSVNWNADNHPSGLYFVRIIAGEFTNTQKLILMK